MKFSAPDTDITQLPDFKRVTPAWRDWVNAQMADQILVPGRNYGAYDDGQNNGFQHGRNSAFAANKMQAALLYADGLGLDAEKMIQSLDLCLEFLVKRQFETGELDLGGHHSPNEVGFPTTALAIGYMCMKERLPNLPQGIFEKLEVFLKKAGEALLEGQGYTANHRWAAACSPLAALYRVWEDPRYLAKIEDYLSDGIDCNEDGCWYHENSRNYDQVANWGMVNLVDLLGKNELMQHVVNNGYFVLDLLQPNGEMDGSFSHRQDRGEANLWRMGFTLARRFAVETGDGRFTTLALEAFERNPSPVTANMIPIFYQLEKCPQDMPEPLPLRGPLKKYYPASGLYRYRNESTALTLFKEHGGHHFDTVLDQWGGPKRSEDWIHLHHGDVVLQSLHLSAAAAGGAQMTEMECSGDTVKFGGEKTGWDHTLIFRPGAPKHRMKRDYSYGAEISMVSEKQINLSLQASSKRALVGGISLCFRPGITMQEEGSEPVVLEAGAVYHPKGGASLTLVDANGVKVKISGLPEAEHTFDTRPKLSIASGLKKDCACLYLGHYFPMDCELSFELS